ncbi:MAG TPA: hypothetical protein VM492_04205 [Sumerlaeia bacterium]|nr:hypothetical protein [Sumerlaeia bacterium]
MDARLRTVLATTLFFAAVSTLCAEPSRITGPSSTTTSEKTVTVSVTRTGKKRHSAGCPSLTKSSIPISLENAKARGCTPCSRCTPPG